MKRARMFIALAALALVPPMAMAAREDARQPINIRSNTVDVNEKTGVATYRGNVVLTQGTLRLDASRLEARLRDGRMHSVRAWGTPVKLRSRTDDGEDLYANAERLEYHVIERRVELHENVALTRGNDTVEAETVSYHFDTQQLSARGGRNAVSATIQPPAPRTSP